jgi:hypothetical protein
MPRGRSIFPRRAVVKGAAASPAARPDSPSSRAPAPLADARIDESIRRLVDSTPFVDTHEHLIEEEQRLTGRSERIQADDWSFLIAHYVGSDLMTCGMPPADHEAFFSPETDPIRKWELLEPYWPRVQNAGYARAVEVAVQGLYGVEGMCREAIGRIQDGYRRAIRPGFYKTVLRDVAGIESCQVNSLEVPFSETAQPRLLMQDLSILGMHMGPDVEAYADPSGIAVRDLADWHRVIDWWFETYGPYAVAVKSQAAYSRNIDFDDVPPEEVEDVFRKTVEKDPVDPGDEKRLQDYWDATAATYEDPPAAWVLEAPRLLAWREDKIIYTPRWSPVAMFDELVPA